MRGACCKNEKLMTRAECRAQSERRSAFKKYGCVAALVHSHGGFPDPVEFVLVDADVLGAVACDRACTGGCVGVLFCSEWVHRAK